MPKNINTPNITSLWAVLATTSSIDQPTNNVSLYNVIEAIQVERQGVQVEGEIGAVPLGNEFVVLLHRDQGIDTDYTTQGVITLEDPDGKELQKIEGPLEFKKGMKRVRIFVKSQVIPVTKAGEYHFVMRLAQSQEVLVRLPLEVTIA